MAPTPSGSNCRPFRCANRIGAFAGRFGEIETVTFEFTYDDTFRQEVVDGIDLLDRDRWGDQGALEPMTDDNDGETEGTHSEVPYSALPPADDYPGTQLLDPDADSGTDSGDEVPMSGDAAFVVTLLESGSRAGRRRRPIPARLAADAVQTACRSRTCRCALGSNGTGNRPSTTHSSLHERSIASSGSTTEAPSQTRDRAIRVTITVESPPQTARHQGYETAFVEMEPLELVVPEP